MTSQHLVVTTEEAVKQVKCTNSCVLLRNVWWNLCQRRPSILEHSCAAISCM